LESFDAHRRKSHYDRTAGPLRRFRFGPATGDPSAPRESYDCRRNRPTCHAPKGRFRFDWNLHDECLLNELERKGAGAIATSPQQLWAEPKVLGRE